MTAPTRKTNPNPSKTATKEHTEMSTTTEAPKAKTPRTRKPMTDATVIDINAKTPRVETTRKPRQPKAEASQPPAPQPKAGFDSEARSCLCGCEGPLKGKKAMFVPGHDARMAGIVGRALVGAGASEKAALLATLPSEALQRKALRVADTAAAKIAKRKSD